MEIDMHNKKIIKLSIFEILIGFFNGSWLLFHKKTKFFKVVVMFCTEYKLIYLNNLKL